MKSMLKRIWNEYLDGVYKFYSPMWKNGHLGFH